MSEQPGPDELAAALKALAPRPVDIQRDRLMFAAGRTAEATRCRHWQWGTGLMTAASVGLALILVMRPEHEVRVVYVPAPSVLTPPRPVTRVEAPTPAEPSQTEAIPWRLQQALLQIGVGESAPPTNAAEMEEVTEPPQEQRGGSAWEWRKEVLLHPSILEGGQ